MHLLLPTTYLHSFPYIQLFAKDSSNLEDHCQLFLQLVLRLCSLWSDVSLGIDIDEKGKKNDESLALVWHHSA